MGEKTGIEWTDATFNPWIGCTAVSEACKFCYAKTLVEGRMGGDFDERRRTVRANWRKPLAWDWAAAASGKRLRVFCASLADVFDNQVPDDWRADLWSLISATPHLDWQLLTKRPQNIAKMLPPDWGEGGWPNVWLGTTVEDQTEADRRIPHLRAVPARVRFLSCEPLLGPLDITEHLWGLPGNTDCGDCARDEDCECGFQTRHANGLPSISWVIAGGESGSKARPSHPDWFRGLRDQCASADVPYFFKQWGQWVVPFDGERACRVCGCTENWACSVRCGWAGPDLCTNCVGLPTPAERAVRYHRAGKKAAGALLDGRQHKAFPA